MDSPVALEQAIGAYNEAWNAHDARGHLEAIFDTWPDIRFETRRLYVRDGLVVQEPKMSTRTQSRSCARSACSTSVGLRL
jgi:hypothetical protein